MIKHVASIQEPHLVNHFQRLTRTVLSFLPLLSIIRTSKNRPNTVSIFIRVKNEIDWIRPSIQSIKDIADEIVIVDNGSTDGKHS